MQTRPHTSSSLQPLGELKVNVEYGFDGQAIEITSVVIAGHSVWVEGVFADEQIKRWEDAIAQELREEDAHLAELADLHHDMREAA